MPNIKNNASSQETRRLLLEAAGQVFAERGFHQATILEITLRAGASLASVNYHFCDKAELYSAVMRNVICDASDLLPPDDQLRGTPSDRLTQFIRHFVRHLLNKEGCNSRCRWWEKVLIAREMAQHSPLLDPLLEGVIRPLFIRVGELVQEVAGRTFTDDQRALTASSVIGQCLHYIDHRECIGRLNPKLRIPEDADAIADHIAAFSIAGIRGLPRSQGEPPSPAKSPSRARPARTA